MLSVTRSSPWADGCARALADEGRLRRHFRLPAVAVLAAGGLLVSSLVHVAARGQNEVARNQQEHVARSAIEAEFDKLADIATDYAWWDDAIHHLIDEVDLVWADRNVGGYLQENAGVSATFVLDAGDSTVYAMVGGALVPDPVEARLGPLALDLVRASRAVPVPPLVPRRAVMELGGVPQLVVAVPLTPEPGSPLEVAPERRGVLVLARPLDRNVLGRIGGRFLLDGPAFVDPRAAVDDAMARIVLAGVDGEPVTALTWHPARPGHALLVRLLPAVLAVGALIALFAWRVNRVWSGAVRRLGQMDHQLAAVLDHAADAIVTIGPDGGITSLNRAAERLFGRTAVSVLGTMPGDLLRSPDGSRFRLDPGTPPGTVELSACRPDGSLVPVELSFASSGAGEEPAAILILRDVTERKETERLMREAREAAELASRAKSEFVANMSHELRTPLNAIIGFSEIIKSEMMGPVGTRMYASYAADIHDSGTHLLSIINDILDLARIETGKAVLDDQAIDLCARVPSCVRLVRERADAAGLTIVEELPRRPVRIVADERKLKQMIANLMSNAIKFTPPGGVVRIGVAQGVDGAVDLFVADTGTGIAPEHREQVMLPFGLADASRTRRHDGTGLGLPLTRALIELHGGSLWLDSEPGFGTTVTLRFPRSRVLEGPSGVASRAGGLAEASSPY